MDEHRSSTALRYDVISRGGASSPAVFLAVCTCVMACAMGNQVSSIPGDDDDVRPLSTTSLACARGHERIEWYLATHGADTRISCARPDGTLHGPFAASFFDTVLIEGRYRDDVPDGTWRFWNKRGVLVGTSTITKGTGQMTWWDFDGRRSESVSYVDGEKHGPYVQWYADGTRRLEGQYQRGQRHGPWSRWGAAGELVEVTRY